MLEVLSISNFLTADVSPIVNSPDPLTDQQPLLPSPEQLPDSPYLVPDNLFIQLDNISADPSVIPVSTHGQYPLDGFPWGRHSNPNLPSFFSEDGPFYANVNHASLFAGIDTQRHPPGLLVPAVRGSPSLENRFECPLDLSAINVSLAGQTGLHDPLNVILPLLAFLFSTYLPQVRSLTFLVHDANVAHSINECIQALPQSFPGSNNGQGLAAGTTDTCT